MSAGSRSRSGGAETGSGAPAASAETPWRYRLLGLDVAVDRPLGSHLDRPFGREPALPIRTVSGLTAGVEAPPRYKSAMTDDAGRTLFTVHTLPGGDLLHWPGSAAWLLGRDEILYEPAEGTDPRLLEIQLLGAVLACRLERAGVAMLHASAVEIDGGAVAFLADHHAGKTGLAAAFVAAGHALLTDDLLGVEPGAAGVWQGRPGYPQMRMWPDEVEHFLGRWRHLSRVHPDLDKRRVPVGSPGEGWGSFRRESLPLRAFFVPRRRPEGASGGGIEIERVSSRDAVIELVRGSFLPRLTQGMGWQPDRLARFARLAAGVPLFSLAYPSGFDELPRVRTALLEAIGAPS